MGTIVRDGVRLAYDDRGAGEPAFVFVLAGPAIDPSLRRRPNILPSGIGLSPPICVGTARATSPKDHILLPLMRTTSHI
jgi:hypothetical protein